MLQNQLLEMREKALTEGPPMTIDEIFDIVLPPKSGYVRGRGPGPKPHSKAHQIAEEWRKEAKERANKAKKLNEELLKQMAELKACWDEMEASICDKLRAEMREHYKEQGWTCNSSLPPWFNDNVDNGEWKNISVFFFQIKIGK